MTTDQETFTTSPTGIYTQFEQDGQTVTVVKLQDAVPGSIPALHRQLVTLLGLAPDALLLVLRSEDQRPDQGPAQALYDKYLSTRTGAVADVTWQPLPL